MRTIFLLRGCQGSGKSSLISQWDAENNTLSFDKFRELFYSVRSVADHGRTSTTGDTQTFEKEIVRACMSAAESRMYNGDTLFIDNMNLTNKDIAPWKALADKFFYTLYIVDVQGDASDAELLRRNGHRGKKMLPPEAILRTAQRSRNSLAYLKDNYTVISPNEVSSLLSPANFTVDASRFDKTIIIGDVHGHIETLVKLLEPYGGIDNENNLYIFVGDLIDRGPDSVGVVELISPWKRNNVIVCEGNHEQNMRHVLKHTSKTRFSQTRASREQFLSRGWTKEDIENKLLSPLVPAVVILNAPVTNGEIVVSHAGFDTGANGELINSAITRGPITEFTYGTSSRDKVYRGHSSYESTIDSYLAWTTIPRIMQVHGHRNVQQDGTYPWNVGHIFNLEAGVTAGGCMRALVLSDQGMEKVEVRTPDTPADTPKVLLTEEDFASSELIRSKDCGQGITSYNFTRDAFRTQQWTEASLRARGLFMRDGAIVGRGYDKFFNMGELNGYTRDEILEQFELPVTISRKVNGFLGIMFVVDGELKLFSKSGPTDYSRAAWDLLNLSEDEQKKLKGILSAHNASMTLEIVHPRDPHIVQEDPGGYILDVIRNDFDYTPLDKVRGHIENMHISSLKPKNLRVLHTRADVDNALSKAESTRDDEGIVLRDARGKMSKVKANHYSEVKKLRTALNRALKGDPSRLLNSDSDIARRICDTIGIGRLQEFTVSTLGDNNPEQVDIPRLMKAVSEE